MAKGKKVKKFDETNKEEVFLNKFIDYFNDKKPGDQVNINDVADKINVSVILAKDFYIKNITKIPAVSIIIEKAVKVKREHPYMNKLGSVMIGVPYMSDLNTMRTNQNLPVFVANDEFVITTDTNRIILTKV